MTAATSPVSGFDSHTVVHLYEQGGLSGYKESIWPQENMRVWTYKSRKKQRERYQGEKGNNAKLTKEDILEIRRRCKTSEMQIDIAQDFGISKSHVTNIKKRRVWSHV